MKQSKVIGLVAASALVLVLASCGDKDKEQQKAAAKAVDKLDALELVPDDTPYVFTNARPMPDKLTARMLASAGREFDASAQDIAASLDESADEDPEQKQLTMLVKAVIEELKGKISVEGLASLGVPANGQTMMYGLGLLPVIRMEILDRAKVEALIQRIEKKSSLSAKQMELEGIAYRQLPLGELTGILAVTDTHLIAALLPANEEAKLLPLALGKQKPEKSLASTGSFKKMLSDNHLAGYGDGYIDIQRLTEMALGESQGINAVIWNALDTEPEEISAGCRFMAKSIAQSMPRLSAGLTEATDNSYRMSAVLETSPAIGAHLQKLAAPVPGVGQQDNAMISMGMGFNMTALRDALKAAIIELQKIGANCEDVDQQELAQTLTSLDMAINPMVASVKGFNLLLNNVQINQQSMQPEKLDANLLLAVDDPRGMFGMLGMLNHEFTQLQIPQDGSPVALPLDNMAPAAPKVWVAAKDKSLAFTTNKDAKSAVSGLFTAKASNPAPLFAVSYQGGKLADSLSSMVEPLAGTQADPENAQGIRDGFESFRNSAADYERIDVTIVGDARGLLMQQNVKLK